jgi:hypothetical protein
MADTGLDPFRPLDAVERARASIDRGLSNEGFAPVVPVPDDASEPDWNWQGSRKPAAVWLILEMCARCRGALAV